MLTDKQRVELRQKVQAGKLLSLPEIRAAVVDAGIFNGWTITSNGNALVLQQPARSGPQNLQVAIAPDFIAGQLPPQVVVQLATLLWGHGAKLAGGDWRTRRALRKAGFEVINLNWAARLWRPVDRQVTNRMAHARASARRLLARPAPRIS